MTNPKKPSGIPLKYFVCSEGTDYNFKMLMRENPKFTQPGLRDALIDEVLKLKNTGVKHEANQKRKAAKPRPLKSDIGATLDDEIARLKQNHPGEGPSALWVHLKTTIEKWSEDECEEKKIGKKDNWFYQFLIAEKPKTITYGNFRKKLNK